MKYIQYFDRKLKRKCWRFDFTINNQRIRRGGFDRKTDAERAVNALRTRVDQMRFGIARPEPAITLGHLLQKREQDPAANRQRQPMQSFRWFVEFVGEDIRITQVKQATIKSFVTHLEKEQDRKQSSIRTYLNHIHAALNSVSNYFPLLEWTPPKFPTMKLQPGRDRVLSTEEIAKLLQALESERAPRESAKGVELRLIAADLVRLALLIPARRGELLALTTADLNLDWMSVTILSEKNRTTRAIPLSPLALQILRRRWPTKGKGFFAGYVPKQLITALEKASEVTKIPYGDNVEDGFVFHDLRHTAATVMASSGIDYSTLAMILGHKRGGITSRYIHPSLDAQRRGIQALETFCLSIPGFEIKESREAMSATG